MTGGSDMAVAIEITITTNNSAIVPNMKSVRTWAHYGIVRADFR
jgi:hypothetical protein